MEFINVEVEGLGWTPLSGDLDTHFKTRHISFYLFDYMPEVFKFPIFYLLITFFLRRVDYHKPKKIFLHCTKRTLQ